MSLAVLYDASCDFCRHTAHVLHTLDTSRRLRFEPIRRRPASAGDRPPPQVLLERLHVRDGAGEWSSGGRAMTRIAAEIPVLAPLALVARLPLAVPLVDLAYDVLASHRSTVSRWLRLEGCRFAPDPGAEDLSPER